MRKRKINKLIGIAGVLSISLTMLSGCGETEEAIYRETTVGYGPLVVGITESGSVDIGTVEQTFELDMSALQRVGISDSNTSGGSNLGMMGSFGGGQGGSGGGMDMFAQVFNMTGGNSLVTSSSSTNLTVSEVCVTIGEQVQEGDILYLLEEEGVTELKEELESNVTKAKADLEAVIADQKLTGTTAKYTYESSIAYGEYAETEKANALQELADAVTEKQEALSQAQEELANYNAQLSEVQTEYDKALTVLKNVEWSRDNMDKKSDVYTYTHYVNKAQTMQKTVDSLLQEKEQLESKVEQTKQNIEQYETRVASAKRELEEGKLSAEETYELRQLAYATAQETYDITMAYLEDDLKTQESIYAEAGKKWEEFTSHIQDNAICAKYSGVITGVNLAVGDTLSTGASVVTLYDTDAVTMTVSLDEEDMTDIEENNPANITFTAYPEEIYQAVVTEISDATTDSDGNVTYEVTVTMEGDSSGLFQGMTGEITFITKETQEVLYVSNRAILRDGKQAFVKVKDDNGEIRTIEVKTGFSDGVNVEILEGLKVGDVVLIESKVKES